MQNTACVSNASPLAAFTSGTPLHRRPEHAGFISISRPIESWQDWRSWTAKRIAACKQLCCIMVGDHNSTGGAEVLGDGITAHQPPTGRPLPFKGGAHGRWSPLTVFPRMPGCRGRARGPRPGRRPRPRRPAPPRAPGPPFSSRPPSPHLHSPSATRSVTAARHSASGSAARGAGSAPRGGPARSRT